MGNSASRKQKSENQSFRLLTSDEISKRNLKNRFRNTIIQKNDNTYENEYNINKFLDSDIYFEQSNNMLLFETNKFMINSNDINNHFIYRFNQPTINNKNMKDKAIMVQVTMNQNTILFKESKTHIYYNKTNNIKILYFHMLEDFVMLYELLNAIIYSIINIMITDNNHLVLRNQFATSINNIKFIIESDNNTIPVIHNEIQPNQFKIKSKIKDNKQFDNSLNVFYDKNIITSLHTIDEEEYASSDTEILNDINT